MVKILHLLNSDTFSGAENVACQIIKIAEKDKKYEMFYCSPEGKIRETLSEKDIQFIPIQKMNVKSLIDVYNNVQPQILHTHDFRATFLGVLFSFRRNIKIISHIHSDFDDMKKISVKSLLFLFAHYRVKKVIWVSQEAMENYRFAKIVASRSEVINNMVFSENINSMSELDDESYDHDFVFLGRLTDVKNPMRILKIVELLKNYDETVKVAVVGSGDLQQKMSMEIERKDLTNNIVQYGFIRNPYKILSSSKALIMTSRNEGLPMVILESLSCGVPVVSTPVGMIPNLITNGINGFCSESDEEISAFLAKILLDCDFGLSLKENSLQQYKEFRNSIDFENRIMKLYKDI